MNRIIKYIIILLGLALLLEFIIGTYSVLSVKNELTFIPNDYQIILNTKIKKPITNIYSDKPYPITRFSNKNEDYIIFKIDSKIKLEDSVNFIKKRAKIKLYDSYSVFKKVYISEIENAIHSIDINIHESLIEERVLEKDLLYIKYPNVTKLGIDFNKKDSNIVVESSDDNQNSNEVLFYLKEPYLYVVIRLNKDDNPNSLLDLLNKG